MVLSMTTITPHQERSSNLASNWLPLASDYGSYREPKSLHRKLPQRSKLPNWAMKEIEHETYSETSPLYIRSRNCDFCRGLHVDGKKSRLRNPTRPSELEKTQRLAELSQRAHWPALQIKNHRSSSQKLLLLL